MGVTSTLIYGYNFTTVRHKLFSISFLTLVIFCLGLLTFAWEGIICLMMAFPIGLFFTWFGHWVGYEILNSKVGNTNMIIILLLLSVHSLMAFENTKSDKEDIRSVTTTLQINALPEKVWKNVIAFPQLKDPTELIFKTGIVYPINATINGQGVGSIRHCNFTTGSFIEPIMKELSFYNIHPNHLHDYCVSKQGQFKLTQLANGHTLLEGTTWYVNKIKPGFYWTIWSDHIVHQIHNRVLAHIKTHADLLWGSAGKVFKFDGRQQTLNVRRNFHSPL